MCRYGRKIPIADAVRYSEKDFLLAIDLHNAILAMTKDDDK